VPKALTPSEEITMNRRTILAPLSIVTFALAAGLGLSMAAAPVRAADASLYERLGGQEAIQAVVEDFVGNVAADERINRFFATTDIARLKRLLAEQICAGASGPCAYSGRDMKRAHAGMGVQGSHFDALVGDLVRSLDKFKVPEREKHELLGILGPMKGDIVTAVK
jgi:hemoglobin